MKKWFNNTIFFRFISPEAKSFPNRTHIEMISALGKEKQKEILDSINYAKRIQLALMASEKQIDKTLKKIENS